MQSTNYKTYTRADTLSLGQEIPQLLLNPGTYRQSNQEQQMNQILTNMNPD